MFRKLLSRFTKVTDLLRGFRRVDEELFEELEESLILSDVGPGTAARLVEELRQAARRQRLADGEQVRSWLQGRITELLWSELSGLRWGAQAPTLVLVVGVNGTGKTTSVAKLARWAQRQGRRPLLAAADTFRAAAIDQLQVWGDRLGIDVVHHREGADPGAVIFDAVQAARARGADLVVADTAGRIHTRANLMEELKKVARVSARALERDPDEVLLVLDGTVGQNALSQARAFGDAVSLSGIILTKMDGTARGGAILTVTEELRLPIRFVGTGEKADDLQPFDAAAFSEALFGNGATHQ